MTNSWWNPPATPSIEQPAAVNELLQSIGQAPVSTLDTSNPDVSIAWNTLVATSRDVQAEGWTFNREYEITAIRSAATESKDYILIADNELQVDLVDNLNNKYHDGVVRTTKFNGLTQRFLYDRYQHSNTWDYNPLVNKIFYFDWEELPIPIQNFIIARAAKICSSRITGDTDQFKMLQQREDYCRAQALEYETRQGDYSYFGVPTEETGYISYRPAESLRRYWWLL